MFFRKFMTTCALIATVSLFFFFSFNDPAENIAQALEKYREEYPQEKVFIHHDKSYYVSGDVVWLKAYIVAGSYHQPSPLSQTVHIELVNRRKEVVANLKLKSDKGFAHGSMLLADSLATGRYLLRAYSPWMTNFDQQFFYEEEIQVWGCTEVRC